MSHALDPAYDRFKRLKRLNARRVEAGEAAQYPAIAAFLGLEPKSNRTPVGKWFNGEKPAPRKHRARFIQCLHQCFGLQFDTVLDLWPDIQEAWEWTPLTHAEWNMLVEHVPRCAPNAHGLELIGRDHLIESLVAALRGEDDLHIALWGLPGVGKTVLLRTIGNDARVISSLYHGVLYAELGPNPDVLAILRGWITDLGGELPVSDSRSVWLGRLRELLRERRILLIIDDVWSDDSLATALDLRDCAGQACRVLFSTRSPEIARDVVVRGQQIHLPPLDPESAAVLLARESRGVLHTAHADTVALAASLGLHPLALKMAGRWLHLRVSQGDTVTTLLHEWRVRLDELQVPERRPTLPGIPISLRAIIGLSFEALAKEVQDAATMLPAFQATPLSFDHRAAAAVWDVDAATTQRWLRALVASGLVDQDQVGGRIQTHQVIDAYLSAATPAVAYLRHARYFADLAQRYDRERQQPNTLFTAMDNFDRDIAQMAAAVDRALHTPDDAHWHRCLLDIILATRTYLDTRSRQTQRFQWAQAALATPIVQGEPAVAATLWQSMSTARFRLSQYAEAFQYATTALEWSRTAKDAEREAEILGTIGTIFHQQGDYRTAISYYQQATVIAERHAYWLVAAKQWGNQGVAYERLNLRDDSLAAYDRSLALSRQINDHETTMRQIGNKGILLWRMDRYAEAIAAFEEVLDFKRRLGDRYGESVVEGNLAMVYQAMGEAHTALAHYQRSLSLAEDIQDMEGTARHLGNLGVVYKSMGLHEEATAAYERCLALSRSIPDMSQEEEVCSNFGILKREQGDLATARDLFERAVVLAKQLGLPTLAENQQQLDEVRRLLGGTA